MNKSYTKKFDCSLMEYLKLSKISFYFIFDVIQM
jgi:hypothetical protein